MPQFRPRFIRELKTWKRTLASDRSGNVLILFGLALLPMVGSLGLGVEYLRKVNYQARLDTAADAAAIAAITAARDFISANPNNEADPTANAITTGLQRASAAFKANAASALAALQVTPTVDLKRSSQELIANVSYQGSYSSSFGRMFGQPIVNLRGNVSSRLKMGTYVDFYLLLDTSGSMGFPTSTDQQLSFAKQNPDMNNGQAGNNCAFACHFPETATNNHGYRIAKVNGVELRIATVGKAVAQLISTAKQKATLKNQFRIGLYPFVSYMETAADLTTAIDSLTPFAGNLENYMDVGDSSAPRGSGGTHFENVLPAMLNKVRSNRIGDGSSSAKAQPYIFLVTDGVANSQYYNGKAGVFDQSKWTGSNSNLLDPSLCTPLKNQGVKISILYIPYMPLQQPYNTNVGYENQRVNSLLSSVPNSLKSCATDGYFYTANSSAEITNALQAMFVRSISEARLTQ